MTEKEKEDTLDKPGVGSDAKLLVITHGTRDNALPLTVEEAASVFAGTGAAALALINPIVGIIAAGVAPLFVGRLARYYETRATRLKSLLEERALDIDCLLEKNPAQMEEKVDLAKESLAGALETQSREKVQFLLYLLEFGLKADLKIEVLFAKRVTRTVARIDELEMVLLAALARMDRTAEAVSTSDLMGQSGVADANMIRSGLAVLSSEGLIVQQGAQGDRFRVSDYGEMVLRELKHARL